ncbi:MAG TPA: ABC transporter substrate-binding protein [Anaeromyxobacteraceae bacterium]|nr:ABC transporter substrate-binding protein [Anaeromyxobacteraceae bacterium]
MRHARSTRRAALAWLGLLLAPAAAPAQVNGVTEAEVLFGQSAAFSGPAKELGRQMKIGIDVAFAAQNDAGGVNGRKLSLLAMDDGYEPERAKVALRELVERRKVFAIIGNVGTPTTKEVLPYVLDKGVIFFGAFTGAKLLRNDPPDRFVFNYRASYPEETAAQVKYLVEVKRIKPAQIAVFAQEDAYGDAGYEGVATMMRKYKRDPSGIVRVGYKRNTTDVAEAVKVIKANASKIRAVVMVPTYKAAARFVQKLKDEGLDLTFTSVSFVGSNELAEELMQLGPRYAEGVVVTQVVPLPTSGATAIIKYRQALQRYAPAEKPGFVSLEGYLAANLMIEGLRRAGKNLNTDTLVDALESIKGLDVGIGTPLTFGPSEHQSSHKVWGTIIDAQGVYRPLDLE